MDHRLTHDLHFLLIPHFVSGKLSSATAVLECIVCLIANADHLSLAESPVAVARLISSLPRLSLVGGTSTKDTVA